MATVISGYKIGNLVKQKRGDKFAYYAQILVPVKLQPSYGKGKLSAYLGIGNKAGGMSEAEAERANIKQHIAWRDEFEAKGKGLLGSPADAIALQSRRAETPEEHDSLWRDSWIKQIASQSSDSIKRNGSILRKLFEMGPDDRNPPELQRLADIADGSQLNLAGPHFDKWVASYANAKSADTQSGHRRAVTYFAKWIAGRDKPATFQAVRYSVAVEFVKHLFDDCEMSIATVDKYTGSLKLYWDFVKQEELPNGDYLFSGDNPWTRILARKELKAIIEEARDTGDTGTDEPFDVAELETLFTAAPDKRMRQTLRLLLCTGMRPGELFSLTVGDIARDGSQAFIRIRGGQIADAQGNMRRKSLKNRGTARSLPVSKYIAADITELTAGRDAGERLLVEGYEDTPSQRNGETFSDRFMKLRHEILPANERKKLYSFRHSFNQIARDAKHSEETRMAICGQSSKSINGKVYASLQAMNGRNLSQADCEQLTELMGDCLNTFLDGERTAKLKAAMGLADKPARKKAA